MILIRETRHEQGIMAIFIAAICLLPIFAVFSHRGVAVLVFLMGAAVASRIELWRLAFVTFILRPNYKDPLVFGCLGFIALCVWVSLSSIWSPQPDTFKLGLNLFAPFFFGGLILWEITRRPPERVYLLAKIFAMSVLFSLGLLIVEILSGGPLRDIVPPKDLSVSRFKDMTALGRGQTLILFSTFPAWLILIRRLEHAEKSIGVFWSKVLRFSLPLVLTGLFIWAAWVLGIISNAIGVIVGSIAAVIAYRYPRMSVRALVGVTLMVAVLAPLFRFIPVEVVVSSFDGTLPVSWTQRLYIWVEAARASLECLPFGCGADASRAIHSQGAMITFPGSIIPVAIMPIHPHNAFLQVWLELGLVGIFFLLVAIVGLGRCLINAQLPPVVASAAAGTFAAILISLLVETSIWQVWRLSSISLAITGVALSYAFNLREVEWVHRGVGANIQSSK